MLSVAVPAGSTAAIAGRDQREHRHDERGEDRELHLAAFDLLPEVLRRAADHQARDEDRQDRVVDDPVESRADAAEDDLAQLHVEHRDEPAERGERVVHRVDGAARRVGRHRREQRRRGDAEARLLALQVAAGDAERVHDRVARRFGRSTPP